MGKICPSQVEGEKNTKRLISDAIRNIGKENVTVSSDEVGVPVTMRKIDALAKRLWDIALYSENEKVVGTVAKVILEFTEGKPEVRSNEMKQAVAPVQIIVHKDDRARLEEKAQNALEEHEPRILLGDGMEIVP